MKPEVNNQQIQQETVVNSELKSVEEYNFWKITWRRLRKHKMATVGATILIILYILVIFAPFIAPYGDNEVFKTHFFHNPSKVRWTTEKGLSWPYVYETKSVGWGKFEEIKTTRYPIKLFHRGTEYKIFGLIKTDIHLFGVDAPARIFVLGSDDYGRDLFTRLLFGGRVSMFIGFAAIFISTSIGMMVGGISGYYGGKVDNILMRLVEVILTIPGFFLLLALAAVLPPQMSSAFRFFLITVILSFIGWAGMARVIRGIVLAIKNEEFVLAAKALGASDLRIITKHILPSTTTYVIISATLAIPGYILMESGLSFLGLGIQEPNASWGNMLVSAQSITKIVSFPWVLIPGLMIFIAVLCYNLLGDGLRDALDPKGNMD